MAGERRRNLRHILVPDPGTAHNFRNPRGGGEKAQFPSRDTKTHAQKLIRELAAAKQQADALRAGAPPVEGYQLTIRSEPGFALPLESLDEKRPNGPKLLAARKDGDVVVATVFVPLGGLQKMEKKLADFSDKKTKTGAPKNAPLVASMDSIRITVLRELWGESAEPFPEKEEAVAWEAWLRDGSEALSSRFFEACRARGLVFGHRPLRFPGRTVALVRATPAQLAASVEIVDCLAELRRARLDVADFVEMEARWQGEFARDFVERLEKPSPTSPVVCVLDTGVANGHPILAPLLPADDMFAYQVRWGTADHQGHGTEMAGLAGFGDLMQLMTASGPIASEHALESVKILPPPPEQNPPELYGSITIDACAQPEFKSPQRPRVFSLAVTTKDGRSNGKPSSWSAALDALASGRDDGRQRLFCVSIGNADPKAYAEYPDSLMTQPALDPAQAWNVLTIGASTEKLLVTDAGYEKWQAIAPSGDLSPTSSTSLTFEKDWPAKPDLVLEGGNVARDPTGFQPPLDGLNSLRLLTTCRDLMASPFTTTNATSAATAQAAHLAALLMAEYPDSWPETIRALMVHSGRWTPAMLHRYGSEPRTLLRAYGHGIPSLERARWSGRDALTLVVQSSLRPYRKDLKDGEETGVKAGQMRLHKLPWPREELLRLGAADVRLRVTLSYFIDPNPAERGWKGRYSYASHQLRFDMQRPTETDTKFAARVNDEHRDDDYAASSSGDPGWGLGQVRDRGSCHSDVWRGRAADLALREHIAVYPVGGWWKEHQSELWKKEVRYALVVSIETDEEAVDLYTPVATEVGLPVQVEVE